MEAGGDAVALFVDRARVQDSAFTLDDSVAPIVGTICRRLDGIPLALELAAARLSSMSLKHLSERLDQRFRLLTGGSRNVMPRQQTLQATVDWSFDLLNPAERETLRRLSVFIGGFELEAAEAICGTDGVDALDVMDLLGSLVGKSLVVADRTPESVRYRLLETIRQYSAQELLRAAGDAEVLRTRDRHADFYLRIAEAAAPALTGPGQREWLRRLDLEWDNLHAAFAHLAADDRTDDVLRLGVALQRFAYSRAHAGVLSYLQPAVEQADPAPGELIAKALVATSWLINVLARTNAGRLAAAKHFAERGLTMARELGRRPLEAQALGSLIQVAYFERDLASVQRLGDEAVAIAREIGDVQLTGELLRYLAAPLSGDEARRIRLEALACFRQTGDELLAASELHMLYGLDIREGLIEDARAHLEQAIALAERLGDKTSLYFFRTDLCILLLIEGKHAEAAPMVRRCLLVARRLSVRLEVCEVLLAAACCAAWQGDQRRAARPHATRRLAGPGRTNRLECLAGHVNKSSHGIAGKRMVRLLPLKDGVLCVRDGSGGRGRISHGGRGRSAGDRGSQAQRRTAAYCVCLQAPAVQLGHRRGLREQPGFWWPGRLCPGRPGIPCAQRRGDSADARQEQ
jgi:hypothetical protein